MRPVDIIKIPKRKEFNNDELVNNYEKNICNHFIYEDIMKKINERRRIRIKN